MMNEHDINKAADLIKSYIHRTPVMESSSLNKTVDARIFLKCENLQKTGSFKARGASHAVLKLSEREKQNGVVTHSSGNHGQALAYAAQRAGIKAYIVMPANAPEVKKNAVMNYGGEVIICDNTLKSREETCNHVQSRHNAVFIPPYDHEAVIHGQSTCAAEIFAEVNRLDFLLTPVGGGGLLAGTCLAAQAMSPHTKVLAGEPARADDAYQSLKAGKLIPQTNPQTVADGLRTSLGTLNFKLLHKFRPDIYTVTESEIIASLKFMYERTKLLIEPSSAVPVAVLFKHKELFRNKRIAVILSGGNVDLKAYYRELEGE